MADRPRPGAVLAAKKSFQQQQQRQLPARENGGGRGQLGAGAANDDAVLYTGEDGRSVSSERITVEVHSVARHHPHLTSPSPPPPPEKHRIHLKKAGTAIEQRQPINGSGGRPPGTKKNGGSSGLSGQEAALMQELRQRVEDQQGKVSKFPPGKTGGSNSGGRGGSKDHGREGRRDNNDPLPPPPPLLPTSPHSSVSHRSSSHPYESLPGGGSSDAAGTRRPNDGGQPLGRHSSDVRRGPAGGRQFDGPPRKNPIPSGSRDRRSPRDEADSKAGGGGGGGGGGRDNRRSRSTGPLEMSRRLDSPEARPEHDDQQRRSRRSRSRGGGGQGAEDFDDEVRGRGSSQQRRSRSRGRADYSRPGSQSFRRGRSPRGPSQGSRSRRSRSPPRRRGEGEQNGGERRRREFSPPSPEEAQATLEKMLSR
jgi:hypothetical protein